MNLTDKLRLRYRNLGKHFFLQSLFAIVAVLVLVLVLGDKKVAISSIGSSAFIIFATPKKTAAQTGNVLGGYLIGFMTGFVFSLLTMHYVITYPLVIGMAILIMAFLNIQHPPAVGMALAVAIGEISFSGMGAVMISVIVLSQCRYLMRDHIRNLV